ncbi:MAG: siderophore biosynthesis protein [Synechococcales cyanobacterium RU_4_20]|nr:siderophore biosynthesis protein [Synechococcales cyanobacterium RU_4_20]NJR70050.1 siderophore biosynthesis protein [Synechococcales cyanobacterium CRU_2_2]
MLTHAQAIWKGFHWSFFLNVQGLIICLNRFEERLNQGQLDEANTELQTATVLMRASGASMELAGSFERDRYETEVRTSMKPPQVQSDNFSGLMSWEHAALMKIWKRLQPLFANLPEALTEQHQAFVQAYMTLARSHRAVCDKFGGSDGGSLRFERSGAVETLDKFGQSRLGLIDPCKTVSEDTRLTDQSGPAHAEHSVLES